MKEIISEFEDIKEYFLFNTINNCLWKDGTTSIVRKYVYAKNQYKAFEIARKWLESKVAFNVIKVVGQDLDNSISFIIEKEKNIKMKNNKPIESQNKIAIEKLENLKEIINNNAVDFEKGMHIIITELLIGHIDYQIKKLSEERK